MDKHCFKCDGKGFIDYNLARSNGFFYSLQQCPECRDIEKYSAEVKRRMRNSEPPRLRLLNEITAVALESEP